jgi:hypothetical protein
MRLLLGVGCLLDLEDFSMITHEQELQIKNQMIEEKNNQIVKLEMEVMRLRSELGYIANAKRISFKDAKEFRLWAQSRARHALEQKEKEKPSV